jgi:hypothetical protein
MDRPEKVGYSNTVIAPIIDKELWLCPNDDRELIYANFSTHTHPSRVSAFEWAKKTPWVNQQKNMSGPQQRDSFFDNLQNHKFSMCPRGNSVGTYRLWESLYCGAYPVTLTTPYLAHFRGQLPIVEVDSWDELSLDFLNEKFEELKLKSQDWNWRLLDLEYWQAEMRMDLQLGVDNNANI